MTKTLIYPAALLVAVLSASIAGAGPNDGNLRDRVTKIEALTAAFEAMDQGRLEAAGKTIVIQVVRDRIVVSFMNPRQGEIYGGQAHVTYDPIKKAVVDVLAED